MKQQLSRNEYLRGADAGGSHLSDRNNIQVSIGGTVYNMNDNGNVQYQQQEMDDDKVTVELNNKYEDEDTKNARLVQHSRET